MSRVHPDAQKRNKEIQEMQRHAKGDQSTHRVTQEGCFQEWEPPLGWTPPVRLPVAAGPHEDELEENYEQ
jgi:hypothetical protein